MDLISIICTQKQIDIGILNQNKPNLNVQSSLHLYYSYKSNITVNTSAITGSSAIHGLECFHRAIINITNINKNISFQRYFTVRKHTSVITVSFITIPRFIWSVLKGFKGKKMQKIGKKNNFRCGESNPGLLGESEPC